MTTCPFCGSSLLHSWPPALWFECGSKINTASTDQNYQSFECICRERDKLRQELDKARAEIQRLKGETP